MINFTDYGIGMWGGEKIISFRHALLTWYDNGKRDLPWRKVKDPYYIWVSGTIL